MEMRRLIMARCSREITSSVRISSRNWRKLVPSAASICWNSCNETLLFWAKVSTARAKVSSSTVTPRLAASCIWIFSMIRRSIIWLTSTSLGGACTLFSIIDRRTVSSRAISSLASTTSSSTTATMASKRWYSAEACSGNQSSKLIIKSLPSPTTTGAKFNDLLFAIWIFMLFLIFYLRPVTHRSASLGCHCNLYCES